MSERGRGGFYLILGGIGAAAISGIVTYVAARVQSDAAIKAAIESRAQPLSAYVGNAGIWVLGSQDGKIVFCTPLSGDPQGDLRNKRAVSCSNPEFLGTY